MLIIVPQSLRRDMFVALHASPASGHMGFYKTLLRIWLQFFWPGLRSNVLSWYNTCPHCVALNPKRGVSSEFTFLWPIYCPFWIVHVNLWAPGDTADYAGNTYLMNTMCDMTQFVVTTAVDDTHAHSFARVFMQEVLLKLGLCGMIFVDDCSMLKGLFATMAELLSICFHVVAKHNHKAAGVECYHRFLNKAVAIAANDRDTNKVFVLAGATAAYAWNSSPIDGTDIIHSVPAIGHELRFPLDASLLPAPVMSSDPACAVQENLSLVQRNGAFAAEIVKLLLKDRQTAFCERANEQKTPLSYIVGDIVQA